MVGVVIWGQATETLVCHVKKPGLYPEDSIMPLESCKQEVKALINQCSF